MTGENPTDDPLWQAVIEARTEFLEHQFGPLPEQIQKLVNLAAVWPAGGIYQMSAPRLSGMGVCTTFGLTNADMPTSVRISERSPDSPSGTIEPRPPRDVPPGLAGYGYELLILTPKPDSWPILTLSWFVQTEILNDLDLLGHVAAGNGTTVEGVKIGEGTRTEHFLVQQACSPILARVNLPNGLMHVLTATRITQDELEFAANTEDGRSELLNRLVAAGVGPVSFLDRPSVMARIA